MEDSVREEKSSNESTPRGLNDFLEIHQECFWSQTSCNLGGIFEEKVGNLDDIKRKRNNAHRSFLRDVCVQLWKSCYTETSDEEEAITKSEEKRRRQELQDLHQEFWNEYSSLKAERTTECPGSADRNFPCVFYHSLWFPKTRVSTPITLLGRTSRSGEKVIEQQLAEYMKRYYCGARGVHRVPPVMFHDDKEAIGSTAKTRNHRRKPKIPADHSSKTKTTEHSASHPNPEFEQQKDTAAGGSDPSGRNDRERIQTDCNGSNERNKNRKLAGCSETLRDRTCTVQATGGSFDGVRNAGDLHIHEDSERRERMTEAKASSAQNDKRNAVQLGGAKSGAPKGEKGRRNFVDKINLVNDCDVTTNVELDKLSQDKKAEILRKRKADRAVDTVARRLLEYGVEQDLNLFILTEFEYQSYLQNVRVEKGQFVTNIRGDHDVIVIWREVGIVFIQVKSNLPNQNRGTIAKDLQKALEQLLSDKFTFWQSNRDLGFIRFLPIYCYIAQPFLPEDCLSTMSICTSHRDLVLTQSTFSSSESFKSWVEKAMVPSSGDVFGSDNYHTLISRYVGRCSMRELPNPIKTTGHQIDRIHLTPEQANLLKTKAKYQIIAGNYGTGKTLVLAQLAQDILESNPRAQIHCISCSDISREGLCNPNSPFQSATQMNNLLSKTKPEGSNASSIVFGTAYKMANPDDHVPPFIFVTGCVFFETLKKIYELGSPDREQHFLLDEVPFVLFENDREPHLTQFLEHLSGDSFVWISIASHTYKVDVGKGESPVSVVERCIPKQFDLGYLKYAMRVSKKMFKMVEEIENYTQDGHHIHSEFGHVIDGPYPRLYTLDKCGCVQGVGDPDRTLPCECSEKRLTEVLAKIFVFVENNYKSDIVVFIEHGVEGSFYKRICQLVNSALSGCGNRSNWLLAFQADVGAGEDSSSVTEDPTNVITVADARTFRGCEKRIVVVIDPFRMGQWFRTEGHVGIPTMVLTRCLAQYIHVSWPMEESVAMCYRVLDEYRILIEKYNDLGKVWQEKMREFEQQARREMTQISAYEELPLVDRLIARKLILACYMGI